MKKSVNEKVESLVTQLLEQFGEDPLRDGLRQTPRRVSSMYEYLLQGYSRDVKEVMNGAVFKERYSEMVLVKDIDFFSLCEHHLLPFYGRCHIAYIPNGKIVGLSKMPRIVDVFARRLQVQERLTNQIAETLFELLNPLGVGVVMEARHLCMLMRGVEKQNSVATTSAMLGSFRKDVKCRNEFLTLIGCKLA